MSEQPDSLRAADVDREFVAERLRDALNEGRLTLSEYDDRLRETYAARTYGELKALMTDLPPVAAKERSGMVPASPTSLAPATAMPSPIATRHTMRWLSQMWSSWLTVSLICVAIWVASGHRGDFWPVWVIAPWGAILLESTVTGLAGGEPRRQAEREARRRAERDRKRAGDWDGRKSDGSGSDKDS